MKKKSLYARCEVARAMVQNRRAFAPRVVQSKKRKAERKPWRAYVLPFASPTEKQPISKDRLFFFLAYPPR